MSTSLNRRGFLAALAIDLPSRPSSPQGAVRFEDFGAKGDGRTFDSEAINRALQVSARDGYSISGTPGAIYRLNAVGAKNFVNPLGQIISKKYCVQIPNGSHVDFANSTLLLDNREDAIILSNQNTHILGDRVNVERVLIEGKFGPRTTPMAWFHGTRLSTFENIKIQNGVYTGCVFTSASDCKIDNIVAANIIGQAIMLGGVPEQNVLRCKIGRLTGHNIRAYRQPHQPGNPVLIGGTDLDISEIIAHDCDAGIKISPGSSRIRIASSKFRRGLTQNSGIKIQGAPGYPCTEIEILRAVSEECFGSGVFIQESAKCTITSYSGNNNGIEKKDADISISGEQIIIKTATCRGYGREALYVAPDSRSVYFDKLDIVGTGQQSSKLAIDVVDGKLEINELTLPAGEHIRRTGRASAHISRLRRT